MTAEPDLLPCPFCGSENIDPKGWTSTNSAGPACDDCGASAGGVSGTLQDNIARWNTRANVAHATAAKDAEVEALRAEVERLRAIAGCAYQMAGVHDAPEVWLDRLGQAANGDALPDPDTISDELLPYQPDAVCEAEARAERLAEALREIANQGPHYGPDGTYKTWRHWAEIARAALEQEEGRG